MFSADGGMDAALAQYLVPLPQRRGHAAPLLTREFLLVGGENLHADVIRSGRAMLVDPSQDGLLVAPRDDRVEHLIADRRDVVGREAGAQQSVGVVRQREIGA